PHWSTQAGARYPRQHTVPAGQRAASRLRDAWGGGYGLGDTFSLPVLSFETVLFVDRDTLLVGNDNNYPGNDARVPGTPDDTEMALADLRRTRVADDGVTVVGHHGASGYRPERTLAADETGTAHCPSDTAP